MRWWKCCPEVEPLLWSTVSIPIITPTKVKMKMAFFKKKVGLHLMVLITLAVSGTGTWTNGLYGFYVENFHYATEEGQRLMWES